MDNESDSFMSNFDLSGFVGQQDANSVGPNSNVQQVDEQQHHQQMQHQHQSNVDLFSASKGVNVGVGVAGQEGRNIDEPPMMSLQPPGGSVRDQQVNLDALQTLLAMQMPVDASQQQHMPQNGPSQAQSTSTQALLEQQLRLTQLQQLQQLQQQIFQQQIELISGQSTALSSSMEASPQTHPYRDQNQFNPLPTPASSTEIRAVNPNFVSPMILHNYAVMTPAATPMTQFTASPSVPPQGTSSAPAHLAFQTHTPLPSPADVDFDLSPLTSPWLGAYQHSDQNAAVRRSGTKRGASSSGDDSSAAAQARKRQSPAIRATHSGSGSSALPGGSVKKPGHVRGSASLNSTPALRSRSRKNSTGGDVPADTPSPVDLSMPPPAPPGQPNAAEASTSMVTDLPQHMYQPPQQKHKSSSHSHRSSSSSQLNSNANPSISPVTPASIMNLGRLGLSSGLSPPLNGVNGPSGQSSSRSKHTPVKPKISTSSGVSSSSSSRSAKKSSSSVISPNLKPLLPGGLPPSSAAHLAAHSNYTHHISGSASSLNISPTTPLPAPTLQVRKTSHKAAEQKRRDSLKSSFDDLRLLLPPIPLPSDENYDGEPPLPGAMPPRGPPRGDTNGPNRAVSKLQLLRCGNDYIRRLKSRITRRDDYIDLLKTEIRQLRDLSLSSQDDEEKAEAIAAAIASQVDLDKELDAEEALAPKLGGNITEIEEGDEDGGD